MKEQKITSDREEGVHKKGVRTLKTRGSNTFFYREWLKS